MKNKFIYLAIIAAGFASCEPEFENEVGANYSSGEADFTTYVAVGNSLTAGYMDGTVSRVGQTYSFPNLLAQQFALVGGGAFTQPSFAQDANNLGGILGVPGFNTRLVINASPKIGPNGGLVYDANKNIVTNGLQSIAGTSTITLAPQATAYNNMGVPGAKSFHLLIPGYGSLNPYFARHARTPNATVLADAMSKAPTFFTNWIGANDVLAYATTGGIGTDRTGNPNIAAYGMNDITDPSAFAFHYNLIINGGTHPVFGPVTGLTQNGAKGVVATIPSVTSIPFFTTVPYNPLTVMSFGNDSTKSRQEQSVENQILVGTATINQLNAQLYGILTQATGGRIMPLSSVAGTKNPVLIVDETLSDLSSQLVAPFTSFFTAYLMSQNPSLSQAQAQAQAAQLAPLVAPIFGRARQTTANDLILLTASSKIGQPNPAATAPFNVNGVTFPLQDGDVLIPSEKTAIANATAAYNASIRSIAATKNLAVADMNSIMTQLVSGLRIETGQVYTANYFSGSATEGLVLFSLDGVHPNARGYAVITNEIIKVINAHYKSNLPLHNPSYFPGIYIVGSN
jgi:lysophospholipase L1-like esterase